MGVESRDGVLMVSHGTVETLDDLPGFLLRIRGNRPFGPELLAAMTARYRAIGGSPLAEVTRLQARALAEKVGLEVVVGTRFGTPTLGEALSRVEGLRRVVVLPLAPFSVPLYFRAVADAAGAEGPELLSVRPWGTDPDFVGVHVDQIQPAMAEYPSAALVLTAHSLPMQVIRAGDLYPVEVEASARALGARLQTRYELAYQSGGPTGEWLGPSLPEILRKIRGEGRTRVVLAPIGFVAEHVETLYDLDIEGREIARSLGLDLVRLPAPNAAPGLIAAMARLVHDALARGSESNGNIRPT